MAPSLMWVLPMFLLAACGGGDASDAAVPDVGADVPVGEPGPTIPWLTSGVPPIVFTPCPEGWREVSLDGVTTCDPYPEGGAATCGRGEAHFPGEPGCRPIGDGCPAGDYADGLPDSGEILYVNAGAAAGGDGSMAAPYAGLAEVAWTSLAAGTTVALAGGTYDGSLPLRSGVRVMGACAAETILSGVDAPVPAVVNVTTSGEPAVVENLSIVGASQFGVRIGDGRALTMRGVLIDDVQGVGIFATLPGTVLTLGDVVVQNTRTDGRAFGRGLDVESGAVVEADGLLVVGNPEAGVYAINEGAVARLVDTVVEGNAISASAFGHGIDVLGGARVEGSWLLLTNNGGAGIVGDGATTTIDLDHTIIRDTQTRRLDDTSGRGVSLANGARLEARRLLIEGNGSDGLFAGNEGSAIVVSDTLVRNPRPNEDVGGRAFGFSVIDSARLEATRTLVLRPEASGMFVSTGATATLTDFALKEVQPNAIDDTSGRGLSAQIDARVVGDRVLIESTHMLGVTSLDRSNVSLTNVAIRDVRRRVSSSDFGYGVVAVSASVDLRDFVISQVATCGLLVDMLLSMPAPTDLDVTSGVVEQSEIGACVQVDDYALSRLMEDVLYRDNALNLDITMLPVPDVVEE